MAMWLEIEEKMGNLRAMLYEILALLSFLSTNVHSFSYEVTTIVGPGAIECFHQDVRAPDDGSAGRILEIDYQVLEGGDNDINFFMKDPQGKYLRTDHRQRFQSHEVRIQKGTEGVYEFCFDNKFSRLKSKSIYFELYADIKDHLFEAGNRDRVYESVQNADAQNEFFEVSVSLITESLTKLHEDLEKSRQHQHQIRSFSRQDRSQAEDNFIRVNRFSGLQLFVMVSVSIVQVLMIRGLFTSKIPHTGMRVAT